MPVINIKMTKEDGGATNECVVGYPHDWRGADV